MKPVETDAKIDATEILVKKLDSKYVEVELKQIANIKTSAES